MAVVSEIGIAWAASEGRLARNLIEVSSEQVFVVVLLIAMRALQRECLWIHVFLHVLFQPNA